MSTTVAVGTGAVAKESRIFVVDGSSITATDCSDGTETTDVDATDSSVCFAAGVKVSKMCGSETSIETTGGSSTTAGDSLVSYRPNALTECSSAISEGSESNFKKESDSMFPS